MNKQEAYEYIMRSPHNTNPIILKQVLDGLSNEGGHRVAIYTPGGYECFSAGDNTYCKISNESPTYGQLMGNIVAVRFSDESVNNIVGILDEESKEMGMWGQEEEGYLQVINLIFILTDELAAEIGFPSGGIWVQLIEGIEIVLLTWGS